MSNYVSSFPNGAAVDALLTYVKGLTTANASEVTNLILSGIVLTGRSDNNFIVNSTYNTIDSEVTRCVIGGGGGLGFPNKIGSPTKPAGTDFTPTGWADDTNYPAGAAGVATINGGYDNIVNQIAGTICGGGHNFIKYNLVGHSFIGGGGYNVIGGGACAIVMGGYNSIPTGDRSFIGGGLNNTLSGSYSNILGGDSNSLTSAYSSILGGRTNQITGGSYVSLVGGKTNTVSGDYSAILGGVSCSIAGPSDVVLGGATNSITSGSHSAVVGGNTNTITGTCSSILGGQNNSISAQWAVIAGGNGNAITGSYSFATGRRAKATAAGVFCISDNQDEDFTCNVTGQFASRYAGGYRITGGNVGIGSAPVTSAAIAVTSTTSGFLPPRMTTEQRDAIATPAEGLQIYNLTTHKINFYNGTAWETVTSVVV